MQDEHEEQLEQQEKEKESEQRDWPRLDLPAGIMRLRDEWARLGLTASERRKDSRIGLEPVVFPEPVGDYKVPADEARALLGLSEEAMERLLSGGELDSILVRFHDGLRRMVSQSGLSRFLEDSGMDPALSGRSTQSGQYLDTVIESIRTEMETMKEQHARQLQQFKDILLLELRNLKEQERDLTSFIYDLTAALEEVHPKLRKRKRTTPPDRSIVCDQHKHKSPRILSLSKDAATHSSCFDRLSMGSECVAGANPPTNDAPVSPEAYSDGGPEAQSLPADQQPE
ncbi:MAG: hypothetical protein HYX78_14580 [Armatimonadetes bacterium]|nr:hypothetical protein [Armatimonadota bacterium]